MPLHPRLRPLELFPVEAEGEVLICVRDPAGIAQRVFLRRPAALLALLCDGTRTASEVGMEFARRSGIGVSDAIVERLLGQLDEALLLEGPRLDGEIAAALDAFRVAPQRSPAHAGACYPPEPEELRAYLGALSAHAQPAEPAPGPIAGLVVPHIDYHRGGPVYARAYGVLAGAPDLVIVFGTDHNATEQPFALTRKSYATPLGEVPTDAALVDGLAAELGDWVFDDEFHHKNEHSIEFQAVWLRHVFGDSTPPALPVLCGSLHASIERGESPLQDRRRADFLAKLRAATAGRRVLVVAGADLAHVGPHFGDPESMGGPEARARVEADDRAALDAAATGDAEAFYAAVAAVKDRNRVCGLAPIYATLALCGSRRGVLLDYAQCAADPTDDSFVSIASMVL